MRVFESGENIGGVNLIGGVMGLDYGKATDETEGYGHKGIGSMLKGSVNSMASSGFIYFDKRFAGAVTKVSSTRGFIYIGHNIAGSADIDNLVQ